ncbi:MAG TPA: PAS domain-containing protein [Dongiaceae bacterium]|nr:PAS domain-containing protein [Dongiaceae bacterium]
MRYRRGRPVPGGRFWERIQQLAQLPRSFDRFLDYWQGLAEGQAPDSALFDPVHVLDLIPYLIFADFEDQPFRVRFRHSGTKFEDIACVDVTGRYLDEFGGALTQPAIDTITEHYRGCRHSGQPSFGKFLWPDERGQMVQVEFAIFPFMVHGIVRQCIVLEDYGSANIAIQNQVRRLPPGPETPLSPPTASSATLRQRIS